MWVEGPRLISLSHGDKLAAQGIYLGLFSLAQPVGSGQNGENSHGLVRVGSVQASQDLGKIMAVVESL